MCITECTVLNLQQSVLTREMGTASQIYVFAVRCDGAGLFYKVVDAVNKVA